MPLVEALDSLLKHQDILRPHVMSLYPFPHFLILDLLHLFNNFITHFLSLVFLVQSQAFLSHVLIFFFSGFEFPYPGLDILFSNLFLHFYFFRTLLSFF